MEMYNEFKNSTNKVYMIEKNKGYILPRFLIAGFVFAFIGFFVFEQKHLFESFTSSLQMLTFNLPTDYKSFNILIPVAAILIAAVLFYAVITTFFKDIINKKIVNNIRNQKHTVVFGLGEINRAFLNDKENSIKDIVIVEKDENNIHINEYRKRGFGVIIEDVKNFDTKIEDYKNMKNAIIALGDDRVNIDFAIVLIDKLIALGNCNLAKKLIIHIGNSELKEVFNQNILNSDDLNKYKIDIKTFSYFEECVNELFEKNSFVSNEIIKTNNEIKSVILGDGKLAINIVKNLLILSNLPNKNKHKIYLIDEKADDFFQKVELNTFYTKEKFPTIEIIRINKSFKNIEYFKEEIFKDESLSNIYICYDDEQTNINLAVELNDKIFIKTDKNPNIYLALFNDYSFIKDYKFLDKFIVFGNESDILSKDRLIDEENYSIAKLIHNGYGDEFKKDSLVVDEAKLNKKWFNIEKYSDKLSNISQAKHLNIKLQALGLKKEKSSEDKKILLHQNKTVFDEVLEPLLKESNISYDEIHTASLELEKFWANKEYEVNYMPEEFKTLFEKLIECEHERWNAYHYANAWEYNNKKDKDKKLHDCLKPLSEFKEKELQITVLYDIYSIVYIPNYLSNAGYKISKI